MAIETLLSQLGVALMDGLIFGLQLALIAVGITMFFGISQVLNISHGEFAVLAAITTALLMPHQGLLLGALAGIALTAGVGAVLYLTIIRPIFSLGEEQRVLTGLFITIGLFMLLHGYFTNQYATTYLSIHLPIQPLTLLGASFRFGHILAAAISGALLLALGLFLSRTWPGRAMKATADNEVGARLSGIPVSRLRLLAFVVGATLAGAAGVIRGLTATLGPEKGIEFTILALLVSVVGGIRSVAGAVAAGLLLGVLYTIASLLLGTYLTVVIMLLAAILTLIFRPQGILGEA